AIVRRRACPRNDLGRASSTGPCETGELALLAAELPAGCARGVRHSPLISPAWYGGPQSTANQPRNGKGGGGGKRTNDRRLQGATERRDAGQLALDAAKDQEGSKGQQDRDR